MCATRGQAAAVCTRSEATRRQRLVAGALNFLWEIKPLHVLYNPVDVVVLKGSFA